MNPSTFFSLALLSMLLTGCKVLNQIQTQFTPTAVYAEGSNIRITMPGDNPPGTYKLETSNGEFIAEAPYQQRTTSHNKLATGVFWFRTEPRRLPGSTASACLRIRKPDGTLLPVQTGVFSKSPAFKIPVLEYIMLENIRKPALLRDIALINADRQSKQSLEKQLSVHAVYNQEQCVYPDRGPKPVNACLSRAESNDISRDHCVASNLGCSLGSEVLTQSVLNDSIKSEKGVESFLSILSQNACSITMNRAYNQSTDFFDMLSSYVVGAMIEGAYRGFINNNPNVDEKLVIASLTGLANTYRCMEKAYGQCSAKADSWLRRFDATHQQCTQLKRQLDYTNYRLQINEPRVDSIKARLDETEKRLDELRKSGWRRGRLNQGAESC